LRETAVSGSKMIEKRREGGEWPISHMHVPVRVHVCR